MSTKIFKKSNPNTNLSLLKASKLFLSIDSAPKPIFENLLVSVWHYFSSILSTKIDHLVSLGSCRPPGNPKMFPRPSQGPPRPTQKPPRPPKRHNFRPPRPNLTQTFKIQLILIKNLINNLLTNPLSLSASVSLCHCVSQPPTHKPGPAECA